MEIQKKIVSPSKFFSTPQEIVENQDLNNTQKDKALENWKNALGQIYEGENEGMTSKSKEIEISDIDKAIELLNKKENK